MTQPSPLQFTNRRLKRLAVYSVLATSVACCGRGKALRQAQLTMLKRKGRQHPFYWASFIQCGEWANLDGER
jgi:hypothetical protein